MKLFVIKLVYKVTKFGWFWILFFSIPILWIICSSEGFFNILTRVAVFMAFFIRAASEKENKWSFKDNS